MRFTAVVRLATVQIRPVPSTLVHPCQPPKVPAGAAVNITVDPLVKLATQVLEALVQLMPTGELVTKPEPSPAKVREMLGPPVRRCP